MSRKRHEPIRSRQFYEQKRKSSQIACVFTTIACLGNAVLFCLATYAIYREYGYFNAFTAELNDPYKAWWCLYFATLVSGYFTADNIGKINKYKRKLKELSEDK